MAAIKTIKNIERHIELVDGAVKLTYKENADAQTIQDGKVFVSGTESGTFSVVDYTSYTGEVPTKEKRLECNLSGQLNSGQLSSVMALIHNAKTGIETLPS